MVWPRRARASRWAPSMIRDVKTQSTSAAHVVEIDGGTGRVTRSIGAAVHRGPRRRQDSLRLRNVYPRTVEKALAELPGIADNAVIGVVDEDYGQRLAAFVVRRRQHRCPRLEWLNAHVEAVNVRRRFIEACRRSLSAAAACACRGSPDQGLRRCPADSHYLPEIHQVSPRAAAEYRVGRLAPGSLLGKGPLLVVVRTIEIQFPRKGHSLPHVASCRQLAENATAIFRDVV